MRPSHVSQALTQLIPTRVPVYLWGPPGAGKSDVVRQAAKTLGLDMIDLRAALLDPVDLRGLPSVNGDGRAHWCPPAFLPHDPASKGLLFLDELAQAPPLVQSALLQLTLDRMIGEYKLPDGWVIVAASNRQEDRAGAHRLISPLLNRFAHLDFEVNVEDWLMWAAKNNIAEEIRAFVMFKPSMLDGFDAKAHNLRSFPTPRSWAFVSRVLKTLTKETLMPVVAGCVGEGAASEFIGYCTLRKSMPDVDKMLEKPATCDIPNDPAVIWSVVGSVSERSRAAKQDLLDRIVTLMTRLDPEYATLGFRQVFVINSQVANAAHFRQWLRDNGDIFLESRVAA